VILGLSGRRPVRFMTERGTWINNIDVTHALHPLAIPHFGFHQRGDGSVILRLGAGAMVFASAAVNALQSLFGSQPIEVELLLAEDKIVQYSSDFIGAHA
jgi:phenylacetate-CoA ligase